MKRLLYPLCLSLLATPVAAFTPERAEIMVGAVRAESCTLNGDRAGDVFAPLGLDPMEVQSFVDLLFEAGLVSISESGEELSLSDALCAADSVASLEMLTDAFAASEQAALEPWRPEVSPEQGAIMVGAIRENACQMSDEDAARLLPGLGFTPQTARDVAAVLISGELASVSEDSGVFALSAAFCAADPAQDTHTLAALIASWNDESPADAESAAQDGDAEAGETEQGEDEQ